MRWAAAALTAVTLAACALAFFLIQTASEAAREWAVQKRMLQERWMEAVHPFAIDEGATALSHGDNGLIDGIVTYENGKPVTGATVSAEPIGRPLLAVIPHDTTNQIGQFKIEISRDWFGPFVVSAEKESEGYADMNRFYGGKFEFVTLTTHHRSASVAIRLGPKAGILIGTVSEAGTEVPLNAGLVLWHSQESENVFVKSLPAKYRVLIPSNTDVLMKVCDKRHKSWYFPGTMIETEALPINLQPGATLRLNIRLVRGDSAPTRGC
jgi:hypothetical protein